MPWTLAKSEETKPRLAAVIYNLCEALRFAGILISPFMPDTGDRLFAQLGVSDQTARSWGSLEWGKIGSYRVSKGPALFPRLDPERELAELAAGNGAIYTPKEAGEDKKAPEGVADIISIEDFARVELRAAKVAECEPVKKSDKLLRLQLDLGGEKRQVVSGIAKWYKPEDLLGRKVILVANLKPAVLRGVESNGMILAADTGDSAKVIFVDDSVEPGAKIR
jgi:methionyl-tRNA synthetase